MGWLVWLGIGWLVLSGLATWALCRWFQYLRDDA